MTVLRKVKYGLAVSFAFLAFSPVLLWLTVYFSDQTLSGIRIEGVVVAEEDTLEQVLNDRAQAWADTLITIKAGHSTVRRMRRELGCSLEVGPMLERATQLGHSGNPVSDLRNFWAARRGQLNLQWTPTIDKTRLGKFVERERRRLEFPPKVGISDGRGWSIPGSDGVTLDYYESTSILSHALRRNDTEIEIALRPLPAPAPIIIGTPDGVLFEESERPDSASIQRSSRPYEAIPPSYSNIKWMPTRGNDCYDKPPFRSFCDGPRMVPTPFGNAMEQATHLGLGEISTVRQLLGTGPRERWIQASGGLTGPHKILWPVPDGWFGRGFGYVRKRKEVQHRLHKGVDAVAPKGSSIIAVSNGIVAYSDNGIRGYGNLLIIIHSDGSATLSAHCRRIFVFAGQRVSAGQVVAEVGSTGMSMGPHLHFEYHINGSPIDPKLLFVRFPKR